MNDNQRAKLRFGFRTPAFWVGVITLLAFFLRIWQLNSLPPGWRDDELINSLVISQKVLDGNWAFYYADASGHESLYHILNAAMLRIFGPGAAGIRLLSAVLGTLTVPLTYLVANKLFSWKVGLAASVGLALSFWSLMYSRIGIRHISLPVFMLAAFFFFLKGMNIKAEDRPPEKSRISRINMDFLLAGLLMGLGFYTYFASRGVPLILVAAIVYIWLFHRKFVTIRWKGVTLMFALAFILALPLIITLSQQPESEARVNELAVPLIEAQRGNFEPLGQHIFRTLSMFHGDGDEEWLYNIPNRPVFGPFMALLFWLGVAIAGWYALKPILRLSLSLLNKDGRLDPDYRYEFAGAFLIIWWLIGILPAFVSVPPASLGHTIIAQSAVYILVSVPVFGLERLAHLIAAGNRYHKLLVYSPFILIFLIAFAIGLRDVSDYFTEWPSRGMTRFLYRAEISAIADYLDDHPELTDFGVTGLLAGPWDKLALAIETRQDTHIQPRWFNPDRVTLFRLANDPALVFSGYPELPSLEESLYLPIAGEEAGAFILSEVQIPDFDSEDRTCFQNGLCLIGVKFDLTTGALDLFWEVQHILDLPETRLLSNPPPPGLYAGPRLLIFSHLLDQEGQILAGDDGLWVDPETLRAGDRFRQRHWLHSPNDGEPAVVVFGLYDPKNGERLKTVDGRDHVTLQILEP